MKPVVCLLLTASLLAGCSDEEREEPLESEFSRIKVPLINRVSVDDETGSLRLTQRQIDAVIPVLESLLKELTRIAPKYPEFAEFDAEKAFYGIAGGGIGVSYSHNYTNHVKRADRPSDFGENGCRVGLGCRVVPPQNVAYAMSQPTLTLRKLRLHVWAGIKTGANPSPGILKEVGDILRAHCKKLEQIEADLPGAGK